MASRAPRRNVRTRDVFDDLDEYLAFCKKYGYYYREQDLYNRRSYVYNSFLRLKAGKWVRNMWIEDWKKMYRR